MSQLSPVRLVARTGRRCMSMLSSLEENSLQRLRYMPQALTVELTRLSKDHQLPPPPSVPTSSYFSKTIMQLCITSKKANVTLCMDLLMALMQSDALCWRPGVFQMLERLVDKGWLDEAIMMIKNVCVPANISLDLQLTETLVEKLGLACRLDDLADLLLLPTTVLSHKSLASVAEPFILSGELELFGSVLARYLSPKSTKRLLPASEHVTCIIKAIMLARTRVQMNSAEHEHETGQDRARELDRVGMASIVKVLEGYHQSLYDAYLAGTTRPLESRCSWFHFRQLLGLEGLPCPSGLPDPSSETRFCLKLQPRLEMSNFSFLPEERWMHFQQRIPDLTSQLADSQPSRSLLMSSELFPHAKDREARQLKRRGVSSENFLKGMLLGASIGQQLGSIGQQLSADQDDNEGDEDGDDDDDDDEDDDEEEEEDEDEDEGDVNEDYFEEHGEGHEGEIVAVGAGDVIGGAIEGHGPAEEVEFDVFVETIELGRSTDAENEGLVAGGLGSGEKGSLREKMMRLGQAKHSSGAGVAGIYDKDKLGFSRSFFKEQGSVVRRDQREPDDVSGR